MLFDEAAGPSGEAALPRAALEQAAHWHSVMDGAPSAEETRAFEQWRAAHPDHERAWQRMQALWGLLAAPARQAPGPRLSALLHETRARRRKRRGPAVRAAAFALAALAPAWWALHAQLPWLAADLRSGVGEHRTIELSDGSRLTLNTDSAVDIVYSAQERRIVLRQGEILAEVAPGQASRPFVVDTRDGSATALGTRYIVRLLPDATRVTVTESHVKACPARPGAACQDAAAGQTLDIRPDAVGPPRTAPRDAEAWTQGRLSVSDTPLHAGARRTGAPPPRPAALRRAGAGRLAGVGGAAAGRRRRTGVAAGEPAHPRAPLRPLGAADRTPLARATTGYRYSEQSCNRHFPF